MPDVSKVLWARLPGVQLESGLPSFWKEVGEPMTHLSYDYVNARPFYRRDEVIFDFWPEEDGERGRRKKGVPRAKVADILGKPAGPLRSYKRLIECMGWWTSGYTMNSMGPWYKITPGHFHVPVRAASALATAVRIDKE